MTKTAIWRSWAWLPVGLAAPPVLSGCAADPQRAGVSAAAESFVPAPEGVTAPARAAYNHDQLLQQDDPVSWAGYAGSADFWNRTLRNWQSEFVAVASMAAFAIFLRQRGSPESKPVGAPRRATGAG